MSQNIEIKARAADFVQQAKTARALTNRDPEVLQQEDVFFHVPAGRLKLRMFSSEQGELIFYSRSDQRGPKLSHYEISTTHDPLGLKNILENAYGIRNTVVKTRHLYIHGRTRIHFDQVESLGEFIELEVVLQESDDLAGGESEARELMHRLGIEPQHFVNVAYVDLLDDQCGK